MSCRHHCRAAGSQEKLSGGEGEKGQRFWKEKGRKELTERKVCEGGGGPQEFEVKQSAWWAESLDSQKGDCLVDLLCRQSPDGRLRLALMLRLSAFELFFSQTGVLTLSC